MNRPRIKSTPHPSASGFQLEPDGKAPEDWRTPRPSDSRAVRTTRSVLECASPLALSPVSAPARSIRTNAFTLVGTIGALAVIAVLTAVIAPSVVRRVDHATWTRETADLQTIADAYTQYILTNKTIPGTSTWDSSVANYMSLPVSSITTNSRRFARAFLVDTNLNINGLGLPYTQTSAGSSNRPVSARVMFVSSLARALPSGPLDFNDIWNTPENAKPSSWTAWAGTGDDLRIKRLNLEPLFYQLILVDRDTANQAQYSIDSTIMTNVPSGGFGTNRYYLDGTIVGLGANGALLSRHLLKRSISFVFESGAWPDESTPSKPAYSGTGSDFVNHALGFFNAPKNPYATAAGASQYSVLEGMYTFMFDYSLWANECPHFDYHLNAVNNLAALPEYMLLDNSKVRTDKFSGASSGLIAVP